MTDIYEWEAKSITGEMLSFESFKNKIVLIVNTASACGFTPQYQDLQALYEKYKDKGLVICGFPCNQFGSQESGTNQEIAQFCDLKFNISFPLFEKIDVNGRNTHPLYQFLKKAQPGILGSQAIKWNFTKFLVNREGKPVKRYAPKDSIASIEQEILKWL